jgi:nicotinamide-nucleotide amidase
MDKEIMKASVITIGDELMIGQVVDTNSVWIAQQLNTEGMWVRKRIAVGDDRDEIWQALDEESRHSKLILITGGLGPTADDITKPLLCEYFDSTLVVNEDVLKHVRHLFEDIFKRPFTAINRKQAEVPAACTVLHNARGTAPGMLFEKNGVTYISMPGVPHEMKGIMSDSVIPLVRKKFSGAFIRHRTLLTYGIGESALAEHIHSWETGLPPHLKLAYLPGYGMVRLRITGTGSNDSVLDNEMSEQFLLLKSLVNEWLVTDEDLTIPQVVSGILKEKNKTVGTAESCTGGYIAHLLTSLPGSSAIFRGTVVSYANDVKMNVLHVQNETLRDFGAVSEETVKQMVQGGLQALKTDYCIATSGIMGPDGGTPEKPVGLVWIAVGDRERVLTQRFQFRFDRARNIEMAAMQALNLLRKLAANTR